MTPYHSDPWLTVYQGDCREVMASMEPESVHCVVTSPPYWGLRDYGIGDKGIGLEPTPEAYVANMVAVFREVRRVLRADGTVWLNLGDSYANPPPSGTAGQWAPGGSTRYTQSAVDGQRLIGGTMAASGLPAKNLVGIPWRVAFALQADGWYLRSDIIWSKPNPMPESVTDRPTKAHEDLFLLSKSPRYYYDADAVREPHDDKARPNGADGLPTRHGERDGLTVNAKPSQAWHSGGQGFYKSEVYYNPAGRNLRSVWTVATQPYPGAHFATFPEKLVEPCILAGTSAKGVCPECGAPWVREVADDPAYAAFKDEQRERRGGMRSSALETFGLTRGTSNPSVSASRSTTGWRSSCGHGSTVADPRQPHGVSGLFQHELGELCVVCGLPPIPGTVLDPFAGSGTVGRVAARLSRRAVLIDLNAAYLGQAMKRNDAIPLGLETA
jgi:DNA modification methylase